MFRCCATCTVTRAPSGFHHAPGRGESHGVTRHGLRSRLAGKRSRLTGQGQQAGASGGLGNRKASSPLPLSSTKDHESCCLLCRGHQAAQSSVCGTRHASLGPWGRRIRDVPSAWRSPPSVGPSVRVCNRRPLVFRAKQGMPQSTLPSPEAALRTSIRVVAAGGLSDPPQASADAGRTQEGPASGCEGLRPTLRPRLSRQSLDTTLVFQGLGRGRVPSPCPEYQAWANERKIL